MEGGVPCELILPLEMLAKERSVLIPAVNHKHKAWLQLRLQVYHVSRDLYPVSKLRTVQVHHIGHPIRLYTVPKHPAAVKLTHFQLAVKDLAPIVQSHWQCPASLCGPTPVSVY